MIFDEEVRGLATGKTIVGDALLVDVGDGTKYDRIILNPPYGKMASRRGASRSPRREG